MSDTVGYRARGAIKGLVDTVWDMLGDLPASGTSTAAQRGLPELGGRCYSASALTAGTAVYVSTRTAVGGFPVATVSAAATGTNVATYIMGADIAAGGTGTMVKGAIIKTALDAHLSTVGAAVYFGAAGLPTLTPGSQQVGRVHTATTNAYVAFDVWDSGGVAAVGTFAALDGTAAAPGYAFAGAGGANDGFYRPNNNEIGFAFGGIAALVLGGAVSTVSAGADTAGQDVYLYATKAGTGTTGAKVGGALYFGAGAGGPAATTIASGAGGLFSSVGGAGGSKTGTTGVAGAGGAWGGTGGAGGSNAGTTGVAGAGGAAAVAGGAGGEHSGTSSGNAGAGGAASVSGGVGGAATGVGSTGNGGAGGSLSGLAGAGGATVGGTAGAGGACQWGAGAGAAQANAIAGGVGGSRLDIAGAGGANTGGAAGQSGGAGGAYSGNGGAGGATNSTNAAHTGGAGGDYTSRAGAGGANTGAGGGAGGTGGAGLFSGGIGGNSTASNGGAGGTATLRGGAAGTGGNANGGNVDLLPGGKTGTGLAGEVTVGTSTAGFIPASSFWVPTDVDRPFFVASRAYRVKSIIARVEVAGTDGGAVTAVINKAASGTAITAGTILHTGTINLKGTAATNQVLALSATPADLEIAAGTCIGIDYTGTLTSATGCVTITLAPV